MQEKMGISKLMLFNRSVLKNFLIQLSTMLFRDRSHKGKAFGSCSRARTAPTTIFVQETTSWDVPSLELPGYVCYGSKFGFAMVSEELESIEV